MRHWYGKLYPKLARTDPHHLGSFIYSIYTFIIAEGKIEDCGGEKTLQSEFKDLQRSLAAPLSSTPQHPFVPWVSPQPLPQHLSNLRSLSRLRKI